MSCLLIHVGPGGNFDVNYRGKDSRVLLCVLYPINHISLLGEAFQFCNTLK